MFKLLWDNFIYGIFAALFGGIVSLIVTGEYIGEAVFWFNTIVLTIVFFIIDLFKGKHKESV